jgi:NADP-dependent 3-hydroxy acid dehydrogenase YdfG
VGAIGEHPSQYGTAMTDRPVLLITGASSGIGAATARHAAEAGYVPVLGARSEDKLRALAEETGGLAVRCDVTSWDDQAAIVARALETYGRLDAAFANAGFGGARGFQKIEPDAMRDMVLTNVLGVAYTIRATMPALREHRGHLLLTSSVAGRRALPGSLYSATKHSVTAMGESARLEYDGSGVRVTLIEPGMVDTPFFDAPPELKALNADDIARAVMYALEQPPHVDVNEILIRPPAQPTCVPPRRDSARRGHVRRDGDHAAAPAGVELHHAGGLRVDRVVLADADAVAGLEARAALADDDLAARHQLSPEHLHAEARGVGVAAVAAGAEALLVCHPTSSRSW